MPRQNKSVTQKEKENLLCQRFGIKNKVQIKLDSPIEVEVSTHLVQIPLRFRCPICVYSGHRSVDFQAHLRKHVGLRPYPCHLCSYSAIFKGNLNQHLRAHAGVKRMQCGFCPHKSASKCDLHRHIMNRHTHEKPFKCLHCQCTASTSYAVKIHMSALHGEKLVRKLHSCNLCPQKFERKTCLYSHIRNHTGEKPESCVFCSKGFANRQNQKQHKRICKMNPKQKDKDWVAQQKPFKCHYQSCEYTAKEKSTLRFHLKKHTRNGTYTCSYCSYTAFRSRFIKHHVNKDHFKKISASKKFHSTSLN